VRARWWGRGGRRRSARVGLLGDALLAGRERDHTFARAKEGSFGGAGCGWAVCPGRVGKIVDAEELHVAVLAVDVVGRRVGGSWRGGAGGRGGGVRTDIFAFIEPS
jgi:hypothetical protein